MYSKLMFSKKRLSRSGGYSEPLKLHCRGGSRNFDRGVLFTPHAQRERGKVIGHGVHIYIYLWLKKKFESYFRDRLTFSNVDSRTSCRIYRLATARSRNALLVE